jgi:hypothetical protein
MKTVSAEETMGEIIDLEEMRKQFSKKDNDAELDSLYSQLEGLMKKLEENEPLEFFGLSYDQYKSSMSDDICESDITISTSTSALYNAYYTLIDEEREDLAELVKDIIRMV